MTQATRDALADAETLSMFVAVYCDGRSVARRISGLWRYTDPEAMEHRSMDAVYHTALSAARIAFKAVPGLRG